MGSVIVDIMPGGSIAVEPKKLHPFFTTPKTPQSNGGNDTPTESSEISIIDIVRSDEASSRNKRRKVAENVEESKADNKKPRRGTQRIRQHGSDITAHFLKVNDGVESDTSRPLDVGSKPAEPATQQRISNVTPQKTMQLNWKTDTVGSLSKAKILHTPKPNDPVHNNSEDQQSPKRRGRKPRSKIVKIGYGKDNASKRSIGTTIDEILDNTSSKPAAEQTKSYTTPFNSKEAMQGPNHPFFTGATKQPGLPPNADASPNTTPAIKTKSDPLRPRLFTSTPCSPKKSRVAATKKPFPQFVARPVGLKTPGAKLAAWPSKGMVHVRGDDAEIPGFSKHAPGPSARKSKRNAIHLDSQEMMMHNLATKLQLSSILDAIRNLDTQNFIPPPPQLRLPQKHFESGVKLENRVLREIKHPKHPALLPLRNLLPTSLSAFDKYEYESVNWAQKYTPKSAVEILQYGKEAFLLRDWLQALVVQTVDTGENKSKPAEPPKKKRKKSKFDDFIVDSDDEADEMDEVSDTENDWSPDRRGIKKTVIRLGDTLAKASKHPTRLTNTVVISGPSGCGKTSTIYAIANELDFEVFEINPGNRRSGKDIMEKIGDMTRNHLVQQHQQMDTSATDDAVVAEDTKSSKQATMNSFFKPKATLNPARVKKATKMEANLAKAVPKKSFSKAQKQSLILLDEVDILYEEDKQFWSTVIGLIAQSKRPFIMTCNDESLVPLQALNLHGIFRFSPPPADMAVDRLLMIAACEGHVLRRSAVEALYDTRQRDLRACLMDLNYWCQFAVGGRRGAIEWFYQRWPKGTDVDPDGNVVRVISENTYVEGMGWLARDVLTGEMTVEDAEEELLFEAQDFWQIDIGNWSSSLDLDAWAATLESRSEKFSTLAQYDKFTDTMSVADLFSTRACSTFTDEPIDCNTPKITNKARDDYILGLQLLDAIIASTFDPLVLALPVCVKCMARRQLQQDSINSSSSAMLDGLDEVRVISKIRQAAVESYTTPPVTRVDFANAFDVLAASDKASAPASYLDPSVFDGTFRTIVAEVAPYIRGIVTYEGELQKQRLKLSNLLSQCGSKRMRKTRASHAALEGGSRSTTRAERWFKSELNDVLVMHTAGQGWANAHKAADGVGWLASGGRKARLRQRLVDNAGDDASGSSSDTNTS